MRPRYWLFWLILANLVALGAERFTLSSDSEIKNIGRQKKAFYYDHFGAIKMDERDDRKARKFV